MARARPHRLRIDPSWVSIDVETAGPYPGKYALLSIGACLVADPRCSTYVELIPDHQATEEASMAIHGLTMRELRQRGLPPAEAMTQLADWLSGHVSGSPIMVGFNAPFDWSFINHYFLRYLGTNPLGHAAIDIKALAMGLRLLPWRQTAYAMLAKDLDLPAQLSHNALDDARQQALLLKRLLVPAANDDRTRHE